MEYYLSLFMFTFFAGITPGPNNMMLMASGLNHGIKRSIPHYLGICLGFPVMVAVVGFGMGAIFTQYPEIYRYLKVAGFLYLVYLAFKVANSASLNSSHNIGKPFSFFQAAAFQWLNPKAWAIATGALAAYCTKENFVSGVLSVILFYFINGLICMAFWLKLGVVLKRFLNTEKRIKYFNIAMATLLIASVLPLALESVDIVD